MILVYVLFTMAFVCLILLGIRVTSIERAIGDKTIDMVIYNLEELKDHVNKLEKMNKEKLKSDS